MSDLLLKDSTGKIHFYLETTGGSPSKNLTATDVQVDLKKESDSFFVNKSLTPDVNASFTVNSSDPNGGVTVEVPGSAGNSYTVEVTVPGGTSPLDITKSGTSLTIALAVSAGVPDGSQNTANLVTDAINVLDTEIQATATGTGANSLSSAEGPSSLTGGSDGDFTNLGAGYYELDLSVSDTDELGKLSIRITGTTIRSSLRTATVAEEITSTPTPGPSVPTTTLFGYLRKSSGSALVGGSVSTKVLSEPTIIHPGVEGIGISTELVTTETDSDGYFELDLITGSVVDVFIPSVNYRRTLIVPSTSTNIFDIP